MKLLCILLFALASHAAEISIVYTDDAGKAHPAVTMQTTDTASNVYMAQTSARLTRMAAQEKKQGGSPLVVPASIEAAIKASLMLIWPKTETDETRALDAQMKELAAKKQAILDSQNK